MQKPISLGVIGLGRGFVLTAPALVAHPGVRLAGAADPREEARAAFEGEFQAPAHATASTLLADNTVEAVYVASPSGLHAEHTIAAAKAGKHVLVDKPMATSVADARAMVDAANKIILMCGPSHATDPPVRLAASLIESGQFGRPRFINAFNHTDFVYRPRRPEELDAEGGAIFSQGAHQVDIVRRLAGASAMSVRAATGDWDATRRTSGAYSAFFSFGGDVAATLTYSGYARYDSDELMGWVTELGYAKDPGRYGEAQKALVAAASEEGAKRARTFGGAEGALRAAPPHQEHFGFVLVSCERADLRLTPDGVWVYSEEERRFHALPAPIAGRFDAIDEFVEAVRGASQPVRDGAWGLETVKCCAAIALSGREKREILLSSL